MALFNWFKRKARVNEDGKEEIRHTFSDADRERAVLARLEIQMKKKRLELMQDRLNHLAELQQERQMAEKIARMEEDVYGNEAEESEEENPDALFYNIIEKIATKKFGLSEVTQSPVNNVPLSDENIRALLNEIPQEYRNHLKNMSVPAIQALAAQKFPSLQPSDINRAIAMLKEA